MPEHIEVAGLKKIDLVAQIVEYFDHEPGGELEHELRELVRKTWSAGYAAGESASRLI